MKSEKFIKMTKEKFCYKKKSLWFWLSCVSLSTLLLFILIPPIMGSAFRNIKIGDEVTGFTLKDIDGKDFKIEDHKGKFIIFNFFQLEKEKSQDALKALVGLYNKFKDKDVVFVAITSETEQNDQIKKFKEENKIKFPILIDAEKKVYESYGIFVMPVTALIDKDFKVIYEYSSYMMGYDSEVEGRIKVALGEITMKEYEKSTEQTVIKERSKEEKSAVKKLGQAEVLLSRGRPDEAIELLNEVVELDPKLANGHVLLGDALLKKAKFDDALKEYEEAKNLVKKSDPVAKTADIGIGAIYALKGDYDKAKKVLSMSAMMNPNPLTSGKAYYWLGFIDEKKGDLKGAVKNYKKAVEKLLEKSKRSH